MPGNVVRPTTELMLMMRPELRARIAGSTARVTVSSPNTLVANWRCTSGPLRISTGQGEPGVVDQHIDAGPAGSSFDRGPGTVHRALVGHIQADGLDVRGGGGQAGQHLLAACRGEDQMPLAGELGRRRPSDS